jgi:hypothetical protein
MAVAGPGDVQGLDGVRLGAVPDLLLVLGFQSAAFARL